VSVVTLVGPESPAERAGIEVGDKVVASDGWRVTNREDQGRVYKLLEQLARRGELPAEGLEKDACTKMLSRRFTPAAWTHPESQRPTGWIARTGPRLSDEPFFGRRYASAGFSGQPGGHGARELPSGRGHNRQARSRTPHVTGDGDCTGRANAVAAQTTPHLKTPECAGAVFKPGRLVETTATFLDLGPGQIGLVLADVSRKGVHAALLMANLQAASSKPHQTEHVTQQSV
jgi:hypothetical protein